MAYFAANNGCIAHTKVLEARQANPEWYEQ